MSGNKNNKQRMTEAFSKNWNRLKNISKKDVENEQTKHEMKEQKQPKEKKEKKMVSKFSNYFKGKKQVPLEEKQENKDDKPAACNLQEKKEENLTGPPVVPPRNKNGTNKKGKNMVQNRTLNETQPKELREATRAPNREIRKVPNMDVTSIKKDAPNPKEEKAEQTKSEVKQPSVSDFSTSVSNIITKAQPKQAVTSNETKNEEVSQHVDEVKSANIATVHTDQTNTSKREKLQKTDKNENQAVSLKSSASLKREIIQHQEKHTKVTKDRKTQSLRSHNQNYLDKQIESLTKTRGIDKTVNLLTNNQEFNVNRDKQKGYKSSDQNIRDTEISNAESAQTQSKQSQQQTSEYTIKESKHMNFVNDENAKSDIATHTFEETHKQESAISHNTEEEDLIKECTDSFKQIQKEIEELENLVENFTGTTSDSDEYYYLDETLMKCLFKLDKVPSKNIQTIREKRREGIKHVQKLLKRLDQKTNENQKQVTSEVLTT